MRCLIFLILLPCFGKANAQEADINNTLLWEISGNGLTESSYLFGTFHLLCNEDFQVSDNVKKSINSSRSVYLELDMDDPATIFGGFMLMNMQGGKKLKDLYTPEAYKRIADYFKDSLQTPLGLFQSIKPGFLVSLLYPKMMPCESVISVEEKVMKLAKENDSKKEILGLETMAFQASLFDSIPYQQQADELLKTIDSMGKSKLFFEKMLKAYKDQNLDEIEMLMNNPDYGMEENQGTLLDDRNRNWVDQLKPIMKKGAVFTAVGAGHLPGKTGLIELLRAEGYTVKGLSNR